MNIDLQKVEARLAKARDDVAFYERLRVELLSLRDSTDNGSKVSPEVQETTLPTSLRAYGELRGMVYEVLPERGSTLGLTVRQIVEILIRNGYVFKAKWPEVATNEALVALEKKGAAEMAGKTGLAKIWTKGKLGY